MYIIEKRINELSNYYLSSTNQYFGFYNHNTKIGIIKDSAELKGLSEVKKEINKHYPRILIKEC